MDTQNFGHRSVLGVGLALLCLALAGCVDDMSKPLSPTFGDAVRQNMARQIVNPEHDQVFTTIINAWKKRHS